VYLSLSSRSMTNPIFFHRNINPMRYVMLVLGLSMGLTLSAQTVSRQVIGTTGGTTTAGTLKISSTAGEAITQTVVAGTLTLTQGFQQPDAGLASSVDQPAIEIGYEVYPNPTQDFWNIRLTSPSAQVVDLRLTDMQGRTLPGYSARVNLLAAQTRTWDVSQLAAGTYLLQVMSVDGRYQAQLKLQKSE